MIWSLLYKVNIFLQLLCIKLKQVKVNLKIIELLFLIAQ